MNYSEGDLLDLFRAYKAYKGAKPGAQARLLDTVLAQENNPLLIDCLLTGECPPLSREQKITGLEALLHWLVDQLYPTGKEIERKLLGLIPMTPTEEKTLFEEKDTKGFKDFFVLRHYFLLDRPAIDVADYLGHSEKYVHGGLIDRANENALQNHLKPELAHPQQTDERKLYLVDRCYEALSAEQKIMLRILSLSQEAMRIDLLEQLIRRSLELKERPVDMNTIIRNRQVLQRSRLVINVSDTMLSVHNDPAVRRFLNGLVTVDPSDLRQYWHTIIGDDYESQGKFIEAGRHWLAAGKHSALIALLFTKYKQIIESGLSQKLRALQDQLGQLLLSDSDSRRLALTRGKVAELSGELETAFDEYKTALSSQDITLMAEAYLLIAKITERIHPELTREFYREGINRLLELDSLTKQQTGLLIDLHIDFAWFLMQQQQAPEEAEALLLRSAEIMSPTDDKRRSAWFDALARLVGEDLGKYIELMIKAYILAMAANDKERAMKAALNLAMGYAFVNQPDDGLTYAQKSLKLAQELGDKKLEANCYRIFGVCYFFKQQMRQAIAEYKKAYRMFTDMRDMDWLGWVAHDLAEAYAEEGQQEDAKRYYRQAKDIADDTNDKQLMATLNGLLERFPWLEVSMTPEQREVFDVIQANQPVGRKDIVSQLQTPTRTVNHRLTELLDLELIEKVGKGRATKYIVRG